MVWNFAIFDVYYHVGKNIMKILLFILVSLLLTGCGSRWYGEFELDETTFDSEAMQTIKDDTGFDLPEGTRGLGFRYSPPIDPSFVARLEIPKEYRNKVLKQIEAIPNEGIRMSEGPGEKVTWWPPSQGLVIIDRDCRQANNYFRAILTQEGDRVVLYLDHRVF